VTPTLRTLNATGTSGGGKSVHRTAACPQEEHLVRCSDAAVVAESFAGRSNVVLAQAEELLHVELGHPVGKDLVANEAKRWANDTAGSSTGIGPPIYCPALGDDRVNLSKKYIYPRPKRRSTP
jgi:hypothetical protein